MYILLSNHANLNKTLGQFENLLFVIMSTRENIYILWLELLIQFNQLQIYCFHYVFTVAGPRSAVGNVSGYRCVSDCRSRGREFDPGPVPYFCGD